jgi:hypothetical protein
MGERKRNTLGTEFGRDLRRFAVEENRWATAGGTDYFDIAPGDAVVPACAERLHISFFGGKTRGVTFHTVGFGMAVANLAFSENSADEAVTKTFDGFCNARNFRDVDTGADDHVVKVTQKTLTTEDEGSSETVRLEEEIATINDIAVDHVRFGHEFVRLWRFEIVDMQHFMAVGVEPVGNQHAVTLEVDAFGAHVGSWGLFGQFDKFIDASPKFGREHVVGIIAEAVVTQGDVRRVSADFFTTSAEGGDPQITNAILHETLFQRITIEMGQTARHGDGADIDQGLYGMSLQRGDEVVEGASGMTDGVERCQEAISP